MSSVRLKERLGTIGLNINGSDSISPFILQEQIEESIQRYLKVLETADRTQPTGRGRRQDPAPAREDRDLA